MSTALHPAIAPVTVVPLATLTPHPRNYRAHPEDQLAHLAESIRTHGLYRNIIIARDATILAGHGVVLAARSLGLVDVPVVRLDLDPLEPRALKVLAGDNEVAHLGEVDDRALTELLKEIAETDLTGLLGTGYDAQMLANLVMVTRPASEIADMDEAAEWAGMPEFADPEARWKLIITFRTEQDRVAYVEQTSLRIDKREVGTWTTWWPYKERDDVASVLLEG